MMREQTVFGPIRSRRLGLSLGINLLPSDGKVCNFDCIYCECGWNRDGRTGTKLPTRAEVRRALEDRLAELLLEGTVPDTITFSGDGEPTLNPDFPGIIDDTIKLRDIYAPSAKVSVLSNATRVGNEAVFEALRKVDNPIMKIDAPTNALAAKINRPAPGYDIADVIAGLARFEGDFILQTMFLSSPGFDSSQPSVLSGWMDIVRCLRPRLTMVYTIDRETPEKDLQKISVARMKELLKPLLDEGFNIQFNG